MHVQERLKKSFKQIPSDLQHAISGTTSLMRHSHQNHDELLKIFFKITFDVFKTTHHLQAL